MAAFSIFSQTLIPISVASNPVKRLLHFLQHLLLIFRGDISAVAANLALCLRPAMALDGIHNDHARLRFLLAGIFNRRIQGLDIVTIDILHIPAERLKLCANVSKGADLVCRAVNLQMVIVYECNEI